MSVVEDHNKAAGLVDVFNLVLAPTNSPLSFFIYI